MSYTLEQGYVKKGKEHIVSRTTYPGTPRLNKRLTITAATGRDYQALGITHLVERVVVEGEPRITD